MAYDDDDAILAAEYVLHLLPPDERRAARDRLAVDGGFRALVAEWTEHLVRLTDDVAPETPPPALRQRLAQSVRKDAAPAATGPARGLRRWIRGGFGLALGALATVAILAVVLPPVAPPYSGPFYAADLSGPDSDLVLAARFDPRDNTLSLTRSAGGAAPGRALELWLIAGEGAAPVSLGVLPDTAEARIAVPETLEGQLAGGVLAISDEPPGGSPTGLPTGDVLAVGEVGEV